MILAYLPEHADSARLALDLAERESAHLGYTCHTLYAEAIDLAWVKALAEREDLAEKIDAFVARFGRLQDHIGDKLLPAFARLLGEQPKPLLDVLGYSERMGWVQDVEEFIGARKLRNSLVHEYTSESELFHAALMAARPATEMLFRIVAATRAEATMRGLHASEAQ